jgi:dipeptidyl aminopeptidase/acylaminoacyl peptidase
VLYGNPRGSTGYGVEFANANHHAFPGDVESGDILSGVEEIVRRGYVDESRIYITGESAGGASVAWIIGHSNRFAAATCLFPITNWLSLAGTSDLVYVTNSVFSKPFWQDPSEWIRHSPVMHAGQIETPTLLLTGQSDLRTPTGQSEELFTALKLRGVASRLVLFHDESHGLGRHPSNSMRALLEIQNWFNQWQARGQSASGGATDTER